MKVPENGVRHPRRPVVVGVVVAVLLLVLATGCVTPTPDGYAAVDLQTAFREVAASVLPSIVRIDITARILRPGFPWDQFGQPEDSEPEQRDLEQASLGSGIIVANDGLTYYVLTNDHVIGEADQMTVFLDDGSDFPAQLVGRDIRKDLAIASFESAREIPVAQLGNSDEVQVGDWVLAIGSPFGYQNTVTAGIVSALDRTGGPGFNISDFIQTDAAINQGNSGGALVNLDGEVVGINTWISSGTGANSGLGFAIPINNAARTIDSLVSGSAVAYGWLGVAIQPIDSAIATELRLESRAGALVSSVYAGSPAALAGIAPGDFVTKIDGVPVRDGDDLILRVGELEPESETVVEAVRAGEPTYHQAIVGLRSSDAAIRQLARQRWPGMWVYPATDEMATGLGIDSGVVVLEISGGSPADIGGLQSGDAIVAMNGAPVVSLIDFYAALADPSVVSFDMSVVRGHDEITLRVVR